MRAEQTPTPPNRALADLARRQWGVVGRVQLRELGLSQAAIGRRVADGRLVRLHRGVYAVGHVALRPEARALAAVLACGARAVLSHGSAAEHHGLLRTAAVRFEVTTPVRRRCPGVKVHRTGSLTREEITGDGPLRLTTVARTALDLAEERPARQVRRILREAEVHGVFDLRALERVMALNPHRSGAARLRAILGELPGAEPNEGLEAAFLDFVHARGLPEPEVHAQLGPYEADFLWRANGVVVETNDWQSHSIRSNFEHEYERAGWFAARHLRIVPVTSRRLARDPDGIDRDLRDALA